MIKRYLNVNTVKLLVNTVIPYTRAFEHINETREGGAKGVYSNKIMLRLISLNKTF